MTDMPRCFVAKVADPHDYTVRFRGDVPLAESAELEAMVRQAFDAGVSSGWCQAEIALSQEAT